ncbi:hypothetical protein BT69DRAFT_74737 [Atractiella rhizophila]|nr:hypothetical protein BT69DRAFT_74737 [Atractiella rhizophila]
MHKIADSSTFALFLNYSFQQVLLSNAILFSVPRYSSIACILVSSVSAIFLIAFIMGGSENALPQQAESCCLSFTARGKRFRLSQNVAAFFIIAKIVDGHG